MISDVSRVDRPRPAAPARFRQLPELGRASFQSLDERAQSENVRGRTMADGGPIPGRRTILTNRRSEYVSNQHQQYDRGNPREPPTRHNADQ